MMKPAFHSIMKSSLRGLGIAAILAPLLLTASCSKRDEETIVLSAPFGPLAYPFIYMVEHQTPAEDGRGIELKIWNNPDQLRAMVAGGQADFFALPTNVAAIFHNKGVDLRLVNVSVWSIFWMVSTDSTKTTLASFRGEKIVVPFRGDMPHIVFENLVRHEGLDPERDMHLRFAGTPQEVVQQLLTGAADHAVLAEPDLSILMYRARTMETEGGRARRFYRTVDIERVWDRAYSSGAEIPIGGTAVLADSFDDPEIVTRFRRDYARAVEWCASHPEETAELVARYFPGVPGEAIVDAMHHMTLRSVDARDAKRPLVTFFGVLEAGNPAAIGGKMPDDSFYDADG